MSCPTPDELLGLAEGELTENRAEELRAHATTCERCAKMLARIEQLRGMVKANVDGSRASASGIMARIAHGDERPPIGRRRAIAISSFGALAAAGIAFLIVARLPKAPEELVARGGVRPSVASHVGITLRTLQGGVASSPLVTGQHVAPDAAFVAGYRNLLGAGQAYLAAFAIDAAGELHWLYPAFTEPSQDPSSLPLPPAPTESLLGDAVELEGAAPGPMRLFTVVTEEPLKVSAVEALPAAERSRSRLRARFPTAQIEEVTVEVRSP